ncbi:hypothetical protein ACTU6V_10060 [Microbacterium sp. A204]|uniref:hypothetical protein n=1 Tax=Microbacterium sp. A204 TaxID=3457321 RepID=UPI003FD35C72
MTEADGPAWLIPPQFFLPVSGKSVDIDAYADEAGWDEGMPPSVLTVREETFNAEDAAD